MINNGNRTEWSSIQSVIIRVINNIGTQSVQELFFGAVHSNDLVKFFGGLRCTSRRKLEIYNL